MDRPKRRFRHGDKGARRDGTGPGGGNRYGAQRPGGRPVRPAQRPVQHSAAEAVERRPRLHKVMAAAGVGSRRQCEELIAAGRVEVDRQVVTELGTCIDPRQQEVRVDGEVIRLHRRREYFLINKPCGVVCTNFDPDGRQRVLDLLPNSRERLFTVGRLDLESEGLILVTNDGELAHRLAHPRFGVQKVYHVLVAGTPAAEELEQLTKGVRLAEGWARAERVTIRSQHKQSTTLEIVLREGRNREIRRVLARIGHKVMQLKRVAIGGVKLKDMAPGEWRRLTGEELSWLRESSGPRRSQEFRHATTGAIGGSSASAGEEVGQEANAERSYDRSGARRRTRYPAQRPERRPNRERQRSGDRPPKSGRPPRTGADRGAPPRKPRRPPAEAPPIVPGAPLQDTEFVPLPRYTPAKSKRPKRRVLIGSSMRRKRKP